jgi:hemerythrin-like domain-containing protein
MEVYMEIYESLKNDHLELQELLSELVGLNKDDDYRFVVIEQIATALIPHSRAEEAVLYNSIRAVNSDNSTVMHSYKEHMEAESLLRLLQVKEKANFDWLETARKLQSALLHHVHEEETNLFIEAQRLFSSEEATMMNGAFLRMKENVAQQGFMKNSFDLVANLMPPKFVEKVRRLAGHNQPNV